MASQTKPGPSLPTGAAATAAPVPAGSAQPDTRPWFLDHLRLVLVCGVVVAHVVGIYAGGWYQYHDPVPADVLSGYVLAIPALIAEMFGMGFFFLIAGYFTPGSYENERKRCVLCWSHRIRKFARATKTGEERSETPLFL